MGLADLVTAERIAARRAVVKRKPQAFRKLTGGGAKTRAGGVRVTAGHRRDERVDAVAACESAGCAAGSVGQADFSRFN